MTAAGGGSTIIRHRVASRKESSEWSCLVSLIASLTYYIELLSAKVWGRLSNEHIYTEIHIYDRHSELKMLSSVRPETLLTVFGIVIRAGFFLSLRLRQRVQWKLRKAIRHAYTVLLGHQPWNGGIVQMSTIVLYDKPRSQYWHCAYAAAKDLATIP